MQAVLGAAGVVLLAPVSFGCGSDGSAAPADLDLRIVIARSAQPGALQRVWRLRCEPVGGDWPARRHACHSLTAALLEPIGRESRDLVPIAPRPVTVSGRAFGRRVSLAFGSRGSSTRRSRYRALESALGGKRLVEGQGR